MVLRKTTGSEGDQTDLYELAQEAGYKVIKTKAEAENLTAEDGKAIVIDETLADDDAMSYDMDLEDGEWGLSDYVKKGIEVLDNDTGFFMMLREEKLTGPVMQMMQLQLLQILLQWMRQWKSC